MTRLLGSELVYARRVDDLEKNRFTMGSLFGKYLLVDDDVRSGARLPDGILKTISEAKVVTDELKYGADLDYVEQYRFFCATTCRPWLICPMGCDVG